MYIKSGKGVAPFYYKLITLIFVLHSHSTQANEITKNKELHKLTVQPTKCVTLHQGRKCFAKIKIQWQSSIKGDFCLYQKNKSQQLIRCWKNSRGNTLNFEFESSEKIDFELTKNDSKKVIAATAIEVSWVHKATPKKRHWRVF